VNVRKVSLDPTASIVSTPVMKILVSMEQNAIMKREVVTTAIVHLALLELDVIHQLTGVYRILVFKEQHAPKKQIGLSVSVLLAGQEQCVT